MIAGSSVLQVVHSQNDNLTRSILVAKESYNKAKESGPPRHLKKKH
jgi:hypothetical protein